MKTYAHFLTVGIDITDANVLSEPYLDLTTTQKTILAIIESKVARAGIRIDVVFQPTIRATSSLEILAAGNLSIDSQDQLLDEIRQALFTTPFLIPQARWFFPVLTRAEAEYLLAENPDLAALCYAGKAGSLDVKTWLSEELDSLPRFYASYIWQQEEPLDAFCRLMLAGGIPAIKAEIYAILGRD